MDIKKTNDCESHRVTCLVYGPSGVGKTSLAKTLGGKTLIVSAESGLLSLQDSEIDYVEVKGDTPAAKVHCLSNIMKSIRDGVEYDNIFVDSLTEIAQIFVEHYQQMFPDRKDGLVMWGEYAKTVRSFVKTVRDLTPYNVVLTALVKTEKDNLNRRFHIPDLNGSIASQVPQYFDEVFSYQIIEKEDSDERVLLTSPHNGHAAKDRSGRLNQFENPDLSLVFNKIRGTHE